MRKFMITLLAIATLGAGSAFAQSGMWAGVSTGYPFGVAVHFGMEDLLSPGLDLRVSASGQFSGGGIGAFSYSTFGVMLEGDVLYGLDLGADPSLNAYVGGGLGLGLLNVSGPSFSDSSLLWNVHGLFGAEYLFTPQWGLFGEVHLGFGGGSFNYNGTPVNVGGFAPALRIGGNYHF